MNVLSFAQPMPGPPTLQAATEPASDGSESEDSSNSSDTDNPVRDRHLVGYRADTVASPQRPSPSLRASLSRRSL